MGTRFIAALVVALAGAFAGAQGANVQGASTQGAGDAAQGRDLFTGGEHFAHGGAPCISCHTVSGLGPLGGGSLGKDLTDLYKRSGEAGTKAMLGGLAFPVMREAYKNRPLTEQETADLTAYFKEVSVKEPVPASAYSTVLAGFGLGGAALLFLALLPGWTRQRSSLSARLRRSA